MQVQPLGREDPLEKEMATCSSILAWKIPWTEEPGGLQSTGSRGVRRDLVTKLQPGLTEPESVIFRCTGLRSPCCLRAKSRVDNSFVP